jgi:hypothetical protein
MAKNTYTYGHHTNLHSAWSYDASASMAIECSNCLHLCTHIVILQHSANFFATQLIILTTNIQYCIEQGAVLQYKSLKLLFTNNKLMQELMEEHKH